MVFDLASLLQQYWLLALLALWAVFFFGGFLFGTINAERTSMSA